MLGDDLLNQFYKSGQPIHLFLRKKAMGRKNAFTIVELLVVITILAVLIALMIPSLRAAKEQAFRVICAAQLRQCAVATMSYANDNAAYFPPTTWHKRVDLGTSGGLSQLQSDRDTYALSAFIDSYLRGRVSAFVCPTSNQAAAAKRYSPTLVNYRNTTNENLLEDGSYFWIGGAHAFNGLSITDPRYSSYSTIGNITDPADATPSAEPAGYLSLRVLDKAVRGRAWINGAYTTNLKGTMAPSNIALFGDYNMLRTSVKFVGNHLIQGVTTSAAQSTSIPLITGMNEVLADGHAVWTDYDTSNRRTHWVGNAGGASGAQLIVATDR